MTTIPDHYAALGIDPTADPEVITAAYRALAKKFHPDTGAAAGTASAERFDQIQKAYEVLRTAESRHAYDLELLEATERELAEHIAAKRRVVVREQAPEQAAPPPDLGDIRPEPAMPPKAKPAGRARQPRSLLPFAIPLLLVMLVGGGAAWTLLPAGPEAPPLPGAMKTAKQDVVVAEPAPAAPAPTPQSSAPAEAKVTPPAPAPQPDAASAEPPVFGSTGAEENPPQIEEAAATPEPVPVPAASTVAKSGSPVFGASSDTQPAAVAPAAAQPQQAAPAPPLPKKKPAPPVKQVQKTVAQPKPKKPVQQQAQLQPRARLQYEDPPQYYPEPDGYPPPGYEPPGYGDEPYPVPPGYEPPPPGFRPPGNGPYRLVIWERQPGRQATAWSAGVVFKSMGKCTRQGVKAVLRRTSGMDPYADDVRVWYECQQLTQR